jgi:hypothetical protein
MQNAPARKSSTEPPNSAISGLLTRSHLGRIASSPAANRSTDGGGDERTEDATSEQTEDADRGKTEKVSSKRSVSVNSQSITKRARV